MMLPRLEEFAPYQDSLTHVDRQKNSISELEKIVENLQGKVDDADEAGASYEKLKVLKEEVNAAERSVDLAKRELDDLSDKVAHCRKLAEEEIKATARERGFEIVKKIKQALNELEQAQKDYKALTVELREKVRFEKPLSGENETKYCGPDPAGIFNHFSYKTEGYKESVERYLQGWPPRERPKSREVELPGQIIIT